MASSAFDTAWAATGGSRDALWLEFAEAISYTPSGSAAQTLNAVVDREGSDLRDGQTGRSLQERIAIEILAADVPAAGPDDQFAVDGYDYSVADIVERPGGIVRLNGIRIVPQKKHKEAFYRSPGA